MKTDYSLVVIGAGPAGMAAAVTAADAGIDVAVVDEQAQPGGQIYRNIGASPLASAELLGPDYVDGRALLARFCAAPIDYYSNASVWFLDRARELGIVTGGRHRRLRAATVVIASGARERAVPFPGWELPGVMTAGAGQILLKSAALVPSAPPVLAGSGPLLLLLAWQYLRAGVPLAALVETTPVANRLRALLQLPRALAAADYLAKGLRLIMAIRRAAVPWFRGAANLRARGTNHVAALEFEHRNRHMRVETSLLLVHHGVVPALELAAAAGCEIDWNDAQQCWHPRCDGFGESSIEGIFVAGDGGAIGGAAVAALDGELAALAVLERLGRIDAEERARRARPLVHARRRHLAIRPLLDRQYRIPDNALHPASDTLVCRCEELRAADIEAAAALGAPGPNQVKAFTRCGMGPCQGQSCGATLEAICAQARGLAPGQGERLRARPPVKPVTLGELAGFGEEKT